jgi:hypothetical protein
LDIQQLGVLDNRTEVAIAVLLRTATSLHNVVNIVRQTSVRTRGKRVETEVYVMSLRKREYHVPGRTVRLIVNALPPDLSPERAIQLLQKYQREQETSTPDGLPPWYRDQVIAALEAALGAEARQ